MSQKELSKFGKTFISYGSYHNNIVNKWIHIICVPIIAATLVCSLSFIPLSFSLFHFTITSAEIGVAIALLYYATINLGFATGMTALAIAMALVWKAIFHDITGKDYLFWVLTIHIIAWIFQFIGHGVFEKRKPALLDNITQILNAPLFVIVQIFDMVGLRSSEMQIWKSQIKKNIEQLRNKSRSE